MKDAYFSKDIADKIAAIKRDGLDKLHVISDFDRTLTKCSIEGRKIPSGIALLREGGYLSKDYPEKAFALFDKYHPIEIDDSIPLDKKSEKMKEWWTIHQKLMIESGMNREVFNDVLQRYPKVFREGTFEFIDFLHKNKVPLLIFSSGLGNLIEGYLEKEGRNYDNIHVIANTFEFDKKGNAKGYKDEIIHVFNKSEIAIKNKDYLSSIVKRPNVLLLGDSLGDLGMSAGIKHKTILRIGFLNEEIDKKLAIYSKKFDVVIPNDGTMKYVNEIIKDISGEK